MYEGKNIHYSPLDNKPLCSYSGKLCKQRRLNGYALCLRHVLEDPAAPFRQCTYTARNKQQCTNPIHQSNASLFCTSHMQLVGLLPIASKTAGKITRNGQHPVDNNPKDSSAVLASLDTSAGQLALTNGPYCFKEAETRCKTSDSSSSLSNGQLSTARTIPMARLYPELAEKLEKHDSLGIKLIQQCSSKSQMKTSLTIVGGNIQTMYNHNHSSLGNQSRLPVQKEVNGIDRLLSTVVCTNNTTSDRSRVVSSSAINSSASLQRALDNPINGTTCVVSTPVLGLPQWPVPVNGQASSSMPAPQLLTEALRGLLCTTPSSTNFAQQQSILQSLFPNLLSYATSGVSCNGNSLIQSESGKLLGKNSKHAQGVVIAAAPVASTLIEPSTSLATSNCLPTINTCSTSASCGIELRPGLDKAQSNVPCMVRPKRLCKSSLERQIRRKIARHSAMKIFSDRFVRAEYNHDILPFGVDSSEEDSDLDHELPRQQLWSTLSSDDEERDTDLADEVAFNIRQTKLQLQKSKERRQFLQLQMRHRGNACLRRRRAAADLALIEAARHCPAAAADAINAAELICPRSKLALQSSLRKCDSVAKSQYCLYTNDDDVVCGGISLPYTNHCLKHIMYNVDQQLFGYCTAKFADGTQCCEPVFDMNHELPVCHAHSANADSHQKQSVEPNSKKQRKKTKPSALTRPPKKGKKKRPKPPKKCGFSRTFSDVNNYVASIADTGAERTATISAGAFTMPTEPVAACAVITPTCGSQNLHAVASRMELGNDPLEEDSLDMVEQLSPGAIERSLEMPMDADQATKFLDEHDLHDVFNKMTDETFDLLTGKNSEYGISKDDDDALVRVLAEVSKPFDHDSLDARLGHSGDQPASRNTDGNGCAMPDDELMKHITSVLFSRNPLSPSLEEFSDSIGDVTGENSSNDVLSITQMLSASSNQMIEMDCGTLGPPITNQSSTVNSTTKLSMVTSSIQPAKNGVAFQANAMNTRDILQSFVNGASFPFATIGTVSSSAASEATGQTVAAAAGQTISHPKAVVPGVLSSTCVNRSFANVSLSMESAHLRQSHAVAAAVTRICPPPVLRIGSLPGLRPILKVDTASLPTTSALAKPAVSGSTASMSSLRTFASTVAPMKQSWFVINQRPLQPSVASSISALPLSGIFPPFAATFCSLPPAASSLTPVLKMSHPLAEAAAMSSGSMSTNSVSLTLGTSISLLAPASSLLLSPSSKNSVVPSNIVRLATSTAQSVFLPTVASRPAVDQKSLSNS